jgi:hypothetical protein
MLGYVIARCGEVGKRYRPGATATYHAVPYSQEWHNTAESLTAWDQLPLDHPIPVTGDEAFPFHTALCGVQLRQDRRARWVAGPQVTCQRCAVMLSQKDSHDV